MRLNINAELGSDEILNFFTSNLKEAGIDSTNGSFTMHAFSDKKAEWVEVKDIKIIFEKKQP